MATSNQINANRENSLLSTGPVTEEGKQKVKYNALTHGILQKDLTPYEDSSLDELKEALFEEEKPKSVITQLLLERIALHTIRLKRIVKAESEHIKSTLDPMVTEIEALNVTMPNFQPVIRHQGYITKLGSSTIETLTNIYSRYETYEENKLYRAIREYQGYQNYGRDT
jgi:hypothetical protein